MASPPPAAPVRSGSPAFWSSDPIPHPTSATAPGSGTSATTTITPPPDTPTSHYSRSSSSSSGLDYYSNQFPRPPSSQVQYHHHSTSISSQAYDQSQAYTQARASLQRKPVPLPSLDQHAGPVIDPVHLSSPLSIENKPSSIPPATRPLSPSSVEGGDSFISVPRSPNRYATLLFLSVPLLSRMPSYTPENPTNLIYPLSCRPLHPSSFPLRRTEESHCQARLARALGAWLTWPIHAFPLPKDLEDPSSLTYLAVPQILSWPTSRKTPPYRYRPDSRVSQVRG